MENAQYKGFAYTKEGNKPTAVYGVSQNDILAKLRSYNVARMQKDKFMSCNIGSLNEETSKYEDYHRYEVATGKDITAVYLNIPPLKRDEFQKVTADLKAAGAKFNPNKKAWYVTAEHAGQELQAYLDSLDAKAKEQPEEAQLPADAGEEKTDFIIEGIEIQYAVRTQDQQIVMIPESELNMLNIKGTPDELLERLNEKAVEQLHLQAQDLPDPDRIADQSEYTISVSSKQYDNRCTIWFNDGREPVEINGYEHGVAFPEMNADSVADFVSEYLKNMDQPGQNIKPEYHEGDAIDCYVPLRLQNISPYQPIYIENVSHIAGHVRGIETLVGTDAKTYEILQEDGNVRTIRSDEIYAPDQARVLLRAAADELTGVQFDLLADRNLSAAQMEEIRFGFKDGLTAEQVALYANPNMTPAEMDLCRIGLNNRLDYVEISRLLKETKELSWTDSRNRLNEAIKNHRVIEETRKAAHEAGLPFSENMTSEEMNPYVYDGSMSAEDYEQMLSRMEEYQKEPTVTIILSESDRLREGETMPLSKANIIFGELDKDNLDNPYYFKTRFQIDYVMNGQSDHYEGRQDLGDGEGTLIEHIEKYHTYYADNPDWNDYILRHEGSEALEADKAQREMLLHEFVPYLKLHNNLSNMERIATEALQENGNMTPTEAAYHTAMKEYVSKCRTMVNSGNYDLPPAPQLKDFDMELADYKEHVKEEIAQEAAAAGMTVEEYAANGYEPSNVRNGETFMDLALNQNGDIVDADTNEIYGSAPADFYGKQVPVENGKRVISQETMDGLLQHIAEMGIELEPLDFTNCIFREVNFQDRAYRTEVFHDTDLSGSEFYHCRFNADMRRSRFRDTSFTETTFRTVLNQCDFSRSRIANCNFQDSTMVDVNFSEAYLKRTRFSGCALENDDFYKSQMDMVDVSESCGVIDSKHFDTISTENMSDRVLWRLSGISDVSYERKEALQKLFQSEKEGSLDSENENWRLGLSRDEEELVDKWDKQQTVKNFLDGPDLADLLLEKQRRQERYHNKVHGEVDQWDKQQTVTWENQQVLSKVDVTYISEDVMKLGYKPTEKLISNIQKLDAITGERHGLKDVRDLYLQNEFQSPELKQTVLEIAEECKQQELARMAAAQAVPVV